MTDVFSDQLKRLRGKNTNFYLVNFWPSTGDLIESRQGQKMTHSAFPTQNETYPVALARLWGYFMNSSLFLRSTFKCMVFFKLKTIVKLFSIRFYK
jgi:hypothetical protein